jgi:hypothetical protein
MTKHKWHKEIKAWAEGAEIEAKFNKWDGWSDWELQKGGFVWFEKEAEYRIKPQPKQPKYLYVYNRDGKYELGGEPHPAMHYCPIIGKIEVQDD